MLSNCIFFAWRLKRRRKAKGHFGYLSVRDSHWGPFWHFLYQERRPYGLRFVSYVPTSPRKRLIPPPLFRGRVRWGDPTVAR